jgi:hypothetical protein
MLELEILDLSERGDDQKVRAKEIIDTKNRKRLEFQPMRNSDHEGFRFLGLAFIPMAAAAVTGLLRPS